MMSVNGLWTPARIDVLGVPVDCLTMGAARRWVETHIRTGCEAKAVIAVNPEKIMKAMQDPDLLGQLRNAGLLLPDGIGVVKAVRLMGYRFCERVPGADLMLTLCELAAARTYRVFLFGAKPSVVEQACAALTSRYPNLRVVGAQHGYLKDEEMPRLVERINLSAADLLFVALGSPRQEQWINTYLPQLKVKVCQGVGGTFDVLAGVVKRAPPAWRKVHLEWLYRLLAEPSRWRRQVALPSFAYHVLKKAVVG
jgi:N-acetylglucosaminyldiphosphoundecaprenol N-acetyl-beta-D-mannosaminyltransferase